MAPLTTLAAAVLLVYIVVWTLQLRAGIRAARVCLPPENQLSWELSDEPSAEAAGPAQAREPGSLGLYIGPLPGGQGSPGNTGAASFAAPPAAAAAADALAAALPTSWELLHSSPEVLHAITFASAGHLNHLPDIADYVHHGLHAGDAASAEGWLHRLEGYVGEQHAAEALRAAGHSVTFAHSPTQAGWDMLVDGHPVQIKEGVSAGHDAHVALQHYPDIPIYTDPHTAAQMHHAMVHGLHGLDPHAISEATQTTAHALDHTFHPTLHVPVVTLAFSCTREVRLLLRGHTELARAAANVAIDVAGVGIGVWGGAKAGALAGAPFAPPVGFAVGAMVGAILGAYVGKVMASHIRFYGFNQARDLYCTIHADAVLALNQASDTSRAGVVSALASARSHWRQDRFKVAQRADRESRAQIAAYEQQCANVAAQLPDYIDQLLEQSRQERRVVVGKPRVLSALLARPDFTRGVAQSLWFRRVRKTLRRAHRRAHRDHSLAALQSFIEGYSFRLDPLEADLQSLTAERRATEERLTQIASAARASAEAAHAGILRTLNGKVAEIFVSAKATIADWTRRVAQAEQDLRREALPVGITLPPPQEG